MIMVRINTTELERLDALRGLFNMSKSEYIRSRILSDVITQRPVVPELNRQAWVELSRAASNLNQIAHHLNISGVETLEVDEITKALVNFRKALVGDKSFVKKEEDF
jgi:hypothetical protein